MNKIVFMGTPDFATKTLDLLYNDKDISVPCVITKIDQKTNRGLKVEYSDVKKYCIKNNILCLQPKKLKNDLETINRIKDFSPDFIVVVAYGQILSNEVLNIPKKCCLNGHASLLPKYRGASPIQSMILNGEQIVGTTCMKMSDELDAGDILLQESFQMADKETADSLFEKLSIKTAELILKTIKNYDKIKPVTQNENEATYVKQIKKEDGLIDLINEDAICIERKIRAYNSWPTAYIYLDKKMLKIYDSEVVDNINENSFIEIQKNIFINKSEMILKTKNKYLKIIKIKPENKKMMMIKDYLNGLKFNR